MRAYTPQELLSALTTGDQDPTHTAELKAMAHDLAAGSRLHAQLSTICTISDRQITITIPPFITPHTPEFDRGWFWGIGGLALALLDDPSAPPIP